MGLIVEKLVGSFVQRTRRFLVFGIFLAILPTTFAHAVSININAGALLAANAPALAAFERAAATWESYFSDPIDVNIDADLASLGNNILGSASSVQLQNSYTTGRNRLVNDAADEASNAIVGALPTVSEFFAFLPAGITLQDALAGTKANLKALGVTGLDDAFGATDATITFSTNFAFDFDNSDGVDFDKIDFETVAVHEIGHALGFVSVVDQIDFLLDNALTGAIVPRFLDLFRFNSDDPNNPTAQSPQNVTEFTEFARWLTPGGNARFNDLDNEFEFSTGLTFGDGRQASHWKDNSLTSVLLGVMDPTLAFGQEISISDADLRALDLIGWDLVAVPGPAALPLLLTGLVGLGLLGWRRREKACQ